MVKLWVINVWWLHVVLFNAAGDYSGVCRV